MDVGKLEKDETDELESGLSTYSIITYNGSKIPINYINMIISKWLRTLRSGNDYFKLIHPESYYTRYEPYIKSVLIRPNTFVRLAVLSDERDTVLGFSIQEDLTLHYVWVHKYNRNQGIANSLVKTDIEAISHVTKTGLTIWNKKLPKAKFNPFY
jgi:hypothetical protein